MKKVYLIREKNGYRITNAMSKLVIQSSEMYCPFGIEEFNKKFILNMEIKKENNDQYNFFSEIYKMDKEFESKDEFKGKTYRSCIKNGLLRCHMPKNFEIYKMDKENDKKIYLTSKELVKKTIKCKLHIANVWTYGTDYGLIIYADEIEVI